MQPSAQTLWNLTLLIWQRVVTYSKQPVWPNLFLVFLVLKNQFKFKLGCEKLQVLSDSPSPTQAYNARKKKKKKLYAVPVFNTLLAVKTINVVHKQHYTADLHI